MIQLNTHNPSTSQMMPITIDARRNARIAEYSSISPTTRARMLTKDADQRSVHPQGARETVDEIAAGVGQQVEQATHEVDDEFDHRAQRLAQPLEKPFYMHSCFLMIVPSLWPSPERVGSQCQAHA